MDIKAPFSRYGLLAGSSKYNNQIKESINILLNSNIDYEFRTTVIPGYHTENDLIKNS